MDDKEGPLSHSRKLLILTHDVRRTFDVSNTRSAKIQCLGNVEKSSFFSHFSQLFVSLQASSFTTTPKKLILYLRKAILSNLGYLYKAMWSKITMNQTGPKNACVCTFGVHIYNTKARENRTEIINSYFGLLRANYEYVANFSQPIEN